MPRIHTRDKVEILPKGAKTVKEYADSKGISTSLFYHWIERKKLDCKIVVFQGINFVLP